jgi:drug/metabolite transporter (DMT)-like permease
VTTIFRTRDLTWLVALAAALWGTDAVLRLPLAQQVQAPTIVFAEHAVLVVVLLPFLPRAVRAFGKLDWGGKAAVLAIGAGASAVATTLFTLSFRYGDPVTPAVIQKFQPVIAIAGAALLLHERLRVSFLWFAVPALAGAWLLAFPDPLDIAVDRLAVSLLALGAAVLWASGTVLGRFVAPRLTAVELTTLRFAIGLPTALIIVLATGSPLWVPDVSSTWSVVGIALIPGLLAMWLYYMGLRRTAASRATLAELAYPLTAAVVGVTVLQAELTSGQWVGAALIVAAVTALSWHESRARVPSVQPSPEVVDIETADRR